jgi:CubicO group peptidase (beta-lactamase class C family)
MAIRTRTGVLIVLGALVATALATFGPRLLALPSNAAGMAARSVCSGAFVAGRPWRDVLAQDVLPANPILRWVDVTVDEARRTVTTRFPGVGERTAAWLPDRGCVLAPAGGRIGAGAAPREAPGAARTEPWPQGDAPLPAAQWGERVDAAALERAVDAAFQGAGDPKAANARAVAIVHRGRLLVNRGAPGFEPGTPLHGWSMTKTVTAMLAHQLAAQGRLALDAPVVEAFPAGREPTWLRAWAGDTRRAITVADLLTMRDGLANVEEYGALGSVPQMLWGEADVAAFAARAAAEQPPATRWRYVSASTNLLARVLRSRFESDAEYWAYARRTLFEPVGARTATLETDADGTWIGSSYLWASGADWARLGELMLRDGRWGDAQVLAPGWLKRAAAPALPDGEGRGYGAQVWRFGDPKAGRCRDLGLPEDLIAMSGHWGQLVAVVPSHEAVIVRLGWTFDRSAFDPCAFIGQVLAALR